LHFMLSSHLFLPNIDSLQIDPRDPLNP
jgi:hypothetical protein